MTVKELFELNQSYKNDIPFAVDVFTKVSETENKLYAVEGIRTVLRRFGNCELLEWESNDWSIAILIELTGEK